MLKFLPVTIYLVANLTPTSAALAWISLRSTHPCLVVTTQSNPLIQTLILNASRFLPLPHKPCQAYPSQAHLIPITNLKPQTTYYLYPLNHFFSLVLKPTIFTTPALSDSPPSLPRPAYGTILNTPNALVLIKSPDQLLASLTNYQGNWLVDLSSFTSLDQLQLQGLTATQSSSLTPLNPDQAQPVPTLTINP